MATHEELTGLDVFELAARFRKRELSPREVTDAYLSRIERTEPRLHAYITVTAERAREAAREAENQIMAGDWRGPFHGVPVALKDLCCTAGIRTTSGSKILADYIPAHDCTIWARLAAQGAVLLGKLNMHEFACGGTAANPFWGTTLNPYDADRVPGGSSSGSAAAIVARSAASTVGSDTGGSIRIPAAFCGCVGLKQTWSRVSRYGILPLADSLDHAGPITRSVRDAAMMLTVIAGHDANDATSSRTAVPDYTRELGQDIRGMRIGVIRELQRELAAEVKDSLAGALKVLDGLGAHIEEVSIPSIEAAPAAALAIIYAEALEYHEQWFRTRAADYSKGVRRMLEMAIAATAVDYIRAQKARVLISGEAMHAFDHCDVIVTPSCAVVPPRISEARGSGSATGLAEMIRHTAPFNLTGMPAMALPTGITGDNAPLSMQIVGRPFDEAAVIRVGDAYERARGPMPEANF
jgi:aspartyl-tRNA(Asn)/glutamyl-tRNA(Gln) amidotransferase subunit A